MATPGYNYQQSLIPEAQGTIQPMSGGGHIGGGADENKTAQSFLQTILITCSQNAKGFTFDGKAIVKKDETQISHS